MENLIGHDNSIKMNSLNEVVDEGDSANIRVAMIEDNKVIRDNVTEYISLNQGLEVVKVASSVEFYLDHVEKNPTYKSDILLLDIGLPGLSGLEAIPLLLKKQPDLDIIMLTTFEEEEIILKAICSGAVGYCSKKSSLEEIVNGIRIVNDGGSYMSPFIAREITSFLFRGQVSKKSLASILKPRQMEILELLADGKSYKEIGAALFLSIETVRFHIKALYKILHVNNKTDAISKYLSGKI